MVKQSKISSQLLGYITDVVVEELDIKIALMKLRDSFLTNKVKMEKPIYYC